MRHLRVTALSVSIMLCGYLLSAPLPAFAQSAQNLSRMLDVVANAPGWANSAPVQYNQGYGRRGGFGSSGYRASGFSDGFAAAAGQDQNACFDARSNYYRAMDQANRAHDAYNRSFYGDKYERRKSADRAYYAARQARREADQAYARAASGDSQARTFADKAYSVARSAQADADRARANADRASDTSDNGW